VALHCIWQLIGGWESEVGFGVLLRGFYWNLKQRLEFGRLCLVFFDQVFWVKRLE
jgi:hypothetical protein